MYLPTGLFVVVSWISFIVPPEVVPGKMIKYKLALLWGEAQKKIAYSYLKVT